MHILIALLPSLLWRAMALLNAAFPAEPRRQNTFVIAGGGAASLLTSPLTGATWSLHSLAWGLLSGLLWSIGIILLLKGFQTWGASRTMPLTATLQLTLNGLIGVVLLDVPFLRVIRIWVVASSAFFRVCVIGLARCCSPTM